MFVNKNQCMVSEFAELRCFGEGKIRGSLDAGKRGLITCQRFGHPANCFRKQKSGLFQNSSRGRRSRPVANSLDEWNGHSGDGVSTIRVDSRFVEQIARSPGELLTDNSGLSVAARKRIEFEFQIFQLLIAEGYWSEQPILDAVAAQRFSLVALMHPLDGPIGGTRWTPALRAALRDAYVPAGEQAGFWLYRPKS